MNGNTYRKVADLQDQIDALEGQKQTLLNNGTATVAVSRSSAAGSAKATGRTMSAAARAKIAATQTARWAKIRSLRKANSNSAAGNARGGKRNMSEAGRKRISKAQRARWAKVHAQQAAAAAAA